MVQTQTYTAKPLSAPRSPISPDHVDLIVESIIDEVVAAAAGLPMESIIFVMESAQRALTVALARGGADATQVSAAQIDLARRAAEQLRVFETAGAYQSGQS